MSGLQTRHGWPLVEKSAFHTIGVKPEDLKPKQKTITLHSVSPLSTYLPEFSSPPP